MKRCVVLLAVMFTLFHLTGSALADNIWIDTTAESLREAEDSIAIQGIKEDYSADRSYIGVDAVIHFTANGKEYELYHVLDTGSGCFALSTTGIEPFPYNSFGGEENAEAEAFFEAEDAAMEAYFAWMSSEEAVDDSAVGNGIFVVQSDSDDLSD